MTRSNFGNVFLLGCLFTILVSSCGLFGIHFKLQNPRKAGTFPKTTLQRSLLGGKSICRNCFDVNYYSLNVQVDPSKKHIKGNVKINATCSVDFDSLQLDLYKNMKIISISCKNQLLKYRREQGAIFVQMPEKLHAGQRFSLDISYDGKPRAARKPPWVGGFVWKKDKNKNPWIGVACEPEGASLWWPLKDDVSDEADSSDVFITVPKNLMAVSNGRLIDSTRNSNGTSTFHWHISYPINSYDLTLYIGNFKLLQDTFHSAVSGKTLQLNHYVLPYNYEKARTHFLQAKKYLAFYEKMYGEYPWPRDGYKLIEAPYAGMEHQTAIAYGNGYKNDSYYPFDYIILHETAHEWWGNSVTAADVADAWLQEGFATYSEALYVESIKGRDAYLNYLGFYKLFIKNKRPIVGKRGIRYFNYKDGDIYVKGAWVLHTLRNTINNDSLFFDLLKTFRIQNNQKQILSETFVDFVNQKTGKDYTWFFDQYLFQRKTPVLEFYWDYDPAKDESFIYYRWTSARPDFKMPVELTTGNTSIFIQPTVDIQKSKLPINNQGFASYPDKMLYIMKENRRLKELYQK